MRNVCSTGHILPVFCMLVYPMILYNEGGRVYGPYLASGGYVSTGCGGSSGRRLLLYRSAISLFHVSDNHVRHHILPPQAGGEEEQDNGGGFQVGDVENKVCPTLYVQEG